MKGCLGSGLTWVGSGAVLRASKPGRKGRFKGGSEQFRLAKVRLESAELEER